MMKSCPATQDNSQGKCGRTSDWTRRRLPTEHGRREAPLLRRTQAFNELESIFCLKYATLVFHRLKGKDSTKVHSQSPFNIANVCPIMHAPLSTLPTKPKPTFYSLFSIPCINHPTFHQSCQRLVQCCSKSVSFFQRMMGKD